jgi:hypothetical protein
MNIVAEGQLAPAGLADHLIGRVCSDGRLVQHVQLVGSDGDQVSALVLAEDE